MNDRELALEIAAWLEAHLKDGNHGPDLVRISGYSENRLRQKFYGATGDTPAGYLRKRRLSEAAKALLRGERIADIAEDFGYSSQDNFTTAFKSWFGLNPGELRAIDSRYRAFLSRIKEPLTIMELTKLSQGDLCGTLMNCVKGASDYFDLDWSMAKLFGYSSFAFLINIHKDICPSGPYCWNKDDFYLRLRDLGIRKAESFNLTKGSKGSEIIATEDKLRAWLDAGKLAMLEFLEYQLVFGYDDKGLNFLKSWGGDCDSGTEIESLSFGTWKECLDREGWVYFTLLEKDGMKVSEGHLLRACLDSALRMRDAPGEYQCQGYLTGEAAWDTWSSAIDRGLGSGHGHWWNAMVWRECRSMASKFFVEAEAIAGEGQAGEQASGLCRELSGIYEECAARLGVAGDRGLNAEAQKAALADCRRLDAQAAERMRDLRAIL